MGYFTSLFCMYMDQTTKWWPTLQFACLNRNICKIREDVRSYIFSDKLLLNVDFEILDFVWNGIKRILEKIFYKMCVGLIIHEIV